MQKKRLCVTQSGETDRLMCVDPLFNGFPVVSEPPPTLPLVSLRWITDHTLGTAHSSRRRAGQARLQQVS